MCVLLEFETVQGSGLPDPSLGQLRAGAGPAPGLGWPAPGRLGQLRGWAGQAGWPRSWPQAILVGTYGAF